jgi:hypothetical protein
MPEDTRDDDAKRRSIIIKMHPDAHARANEYLNSNGTIYTINAQDLIERAFYDGFLANARSDAFDLLSASPPAPCDKIMPCMIFCMRALKHKRTAGLFRRTSMPQRWPLNICGQIAATMRSRIMHRRKKS